MSRIYVGNLDPRSTERDLEDEFRQYGVLRSVWVARKPPGFAFVEFEDRRDANDAIRALNGKSGWRVELSRSSGGGGGAGGGVGGGAGPRGGSRGGSGGGDDMKCYECGEGGHFARECRLRIGPTGLGSGVRARSRSPRYRRSPSYGRSGASPRRNGASPPRRKSPGAYGYRRSRSPIRTSGASPRRNGASPRRRSPAAYGSRKSRSPIRTRPSYSPPRERSLSRSPAPRRTSYKDSPIANGRSPLVKERRVERSISP